MNATLGAEDFSFFQEKVPGVFFWLGTRPKNKTPEEAASNHSPLFYVDETGLELGVRALAHVAVDYLERSPPALRDLVELSFNAPSAHTTSPIKSLVRRRSRCSPLSRSRANDD